MKFALLNIACVLWGVLGCLILTVIVDAAPLGWFKWPAIYTAVVGIHLAGISLFYGVFK